MNNDIQKLDNGDFKVLSLEERNQFNIDIMMPGAIHFIDLKFKFSTATEELTRFINKNAPMYVDDFKNSKHGKDWKQREDEFAAKQKEKLCEELYEDNRSKGYNMSSEVYNNILKNS